MRKEWGMVSNLPITKRIFDEQIQRKPDNYPWAKHFIDTAWETFWTPDEFNFTSDYNDFKVNMTDEERQVLTRTLSAIQQIEVAVKTFWANLGDNLPHPSLRDLGYVMANQEVIHNNAYEKLLTVLGLEDTFEQNLSNPVIAGRVDYLRKYLKKVYENDKKQYVYAITLFTLFVENVSLFSQFFIILHMNRTRGILKDTAQQVKYTRNEEACFTSDAEIMTPNGWRKITDMKVGDKVYQYEIDGSITETKVLHTINKDYKGDIYKVIRRNSIAQVTPDHEMIYFNKNGEYVRKQIQDMDFSESGSIPIYEEQNSFDNTMVSLSEFKTDIMQYDGIVTCVTVPSGNIIVRHPDHDAFIIGNCHAQVGIKIINTIKSEYPELFDDELQQRITDECHEAIECETNVIKWMMGDYQVEGLNVDVLHNFIKKRMIESLDQIGINHGMTYDKSFDKDITWMYEGMLGTNMVDFFASRPVDYARGKAVTVDDLF